MSNFAISPSLLNSAEKVWDHGRAKYQDFSDWYGSNPYTKSLKYLLKAIQKIQSIVELIFDTFLPDKHLEGLVKDIKNFFTDALSKRKKIVAKVDTVTGFIELVSDIGECLKALFVRWKIRSGSNAGGEPENSICDNSTLNVSLVAQPPEWMQRLGRMVQTALKTAAQAAKIFKIPQTLYKFSSLFVRELPNIFGRLVSITNLAATALSLANLASYPKKFKETNEVIDKLKAKKHKAFIAAYSNPTDQAHAKKLLKNLSLSDLKEQVQAIKTDLNASNDHESKLLLADIKHVANLAYIKKLQKFIHISNSKIIKNQFKIPLEKSTTKAKNNPDLNNLPRIFRKLNSPRIQNNPQKLAPLVKTLKLRLRDKIFSEKISLTHKSLGFIPSFLSAAAAACAAFAPQVALPITLGPVVAGISGCLALAKIAMIFYTHSRSQIFIENMEFYLAKELPLE